MTTNRRHASEFFHYLIQGDDSDDSDESENEAATILFVLAAASDDHRRSSCFVRDRLVWNAHVAKLFQEGPTAFYQQYRMEHSSFMKLCSMLGPSLQVDPVYSRNRTGKDPIIVEIILHCLLRWLAGGSYLDIRLSAGISKPSFYQCVPRGVKAVQGRCVLR
jgi:hypothetical protein